MKKDPTTNLTYPQMMVKRRNLFHELTSPRLSTEERATMQKEYDNLLKITSSSRPA